MGAVMRVAAAFLAALVVTTALAIAASTHFVLKGLTDLGVEVAASERLSMTLHDLVQMAPLYAVLIAAGFLVAFAAAAILARVLGVRGGFLLVVDYTVAGAVALFAILTLLETLFYFQIVAGARTGAGFWVQVACGAAGGFLFGLLAQRRVA